MTWIIVTSFCAAGLLLAAMGLYFVAKAGGRDAVGSARQDWIERRSDNDERGW